MCFVLGMSYPIEQKAEMIDKVLESMLTDSMSASCRAVGVPSATFRGWINSDDQLSTQYACARESYSDYLLEKLRAILNAEPLTNDKGNVDHGWVQLQRAKADQVKWELSKLFPKQYGDRVTLAGDSDAPLNSVVAVTHEIVDKTIDNRKAIEDPEVEDE